MPVAVANLDVVGFTVLRFENVHLRNVQLNSFSVRSCDPPFAKAVDFELRC